ncbi:MAG: hypothetical protein K0S44_175 [Bacteroidetes bacterium]|jgi:hypothetical protein|nr:hypothetical protein [Bacteroidota bacterium]
MKKILLITLISFNFIFSQAQTTFEKSFGGAGNDSLTCLQQTSDGGYIICGSTKSFGAGDFDVFVIKLNSSGGRVWNKTFGGTEADYGNDIKTTSDGGYIITGSSKSFNSGDERVYLLKLDVNGNLIWSETLGESTSGQGKSVIQTSDGGYAITGSSKNTDGLKVIYLLKTMTDGSGVFEVHFPFEGEGHSIIESFEGGFVLNGINTSANLSSKNILIKTDEFGNNLWSRTYSNDNCFFTTTHVSQSRDGGYVVGGGARRPLLNGSVAFISKINMLGEQLWAKAYTGGEGVSVNSTLDNGYIISGSINSESTSSGMYLAKTDSLGSIFWSKGFGGLNNEVSVSGSQTSDEGYIVAGITNSYGQGISDAYIIKTDINGITSCSNNPVQIIEDTLTLDESVYTFQPAFNYVIPSVTIALTLAADVNLTGASVCYSPEPVADISSSINTADQIHEDKIIVAEDIIIEEEHTQKLFNSAPANIGFTIFPNPNDGMNVNMSFESAASEEILVVVYDQLGREHYSKIIVTEENSNNVFAIDPKGNLLPGIYMVTATSGKETFSKRLIVK